MSCASRWLTACRPGVLRSFAIAASILLGIGTPVFAQHHLDSWTADDGLPQNIITAIQQTPDGYLWIATLDGLARFDGVRFTVFNRANSPGISSNRFTSLYQDARGDLWLGTEGGAVTLYSAGRFVTYAGANGLAAKPIRGVIGDAAANVWVLCGDTILQWQPASERFVSTHTSDPEAGYASLGWNDGRGFWIVNRDGLRLFVDGKWERRSVPHSSSRPTRVAVAQDGTIWFVDEQGHVARLEEGTGTGSVGTGWFGSKNALGPRATRAVPSDRQTAWRDRNGTTWNIRVDDSLNRSIILTSSGRVATTAFTVLFEDREGNLWLGTN
jgi:ligand-binding sensor domain-containing protein